MTRISGEIRINGRPEDVWAAIADLGAIQEFHPGVKKSYYTTELREGVGASRHCDLLPFGSVEERAIDWKNGESLTLEIFDGERIPPFRTARATMSVERADDGTIARLALEYSLRFVVIGSLLDRLLVRPRFQKMVPAVLAGLKRYIESRQPRFSSAAEVANA